MKTVITAKLQMAQNVDTDLHNQWRMRNHRDMVSLAITELPPTIKLKYLPMYSGQAERDSRRSVERTWKIRGTCRIQILDYRSRSSQMIDGGGDDCCVGPAMTRGRTKYRSRVHGCIQSPLWSHGTGPASDQALF